MDNNKVGKFIASLRKEKGLTQQQLGDKLFVTDKAVSKWERGLSFPDITILQKLALILDADVSEILCGERGKNKKIDIQKEIDKTIEKIEQNQIQRKKELINKIKKISIMIVSIIAIIFLIFLIRYIYYHPSNIKEGNNRYEIGFFGVSNLEKKGLDELLKIISKTNDIKNYNSNINDYSIQLTKKGNIKKFGITINFFDDNYDYVGYGYYRYENKNLEFGYKSVDNCKDKNDCEINKHLVDEYSKSLNIRYISNQIKKIPLRKQIKMSNLKNYEVSIYPNNQFFDETSVIDMRDNKDVKALSFIDYKSGKGGKVSPGIYSIITLSDGSSIIADEVYKYVFDTVDGDIKKSGYNMETDYFINTNNELLFTRNYGNNWIKTDISPSEVKDTLNFYRDISFPNGSWFISTNELVPIAYFYGEDPKLKISTDNGLNWNEKSFDIVNKDIYKDIPHRVVGFTNQNFGYVALGSDWTMGSGEFKKAYLTTNSGNDWESIELPENGSRKTLEDFIMYDENNGIVLLYNNEQNEFPYMYITKDKGKKWEKVEYKNQIPNNIYYISNIDLIEKKGNQYIITLSQGDSATTKVKLKSFDLINWEYESTFKSNIHTVG